MYLPIMGSFISTPALLIITSTPPNSSSVHLNTLRISSSCRTSHAIGQTLPLNSLLILIANSSNFSSLLATAITFIPFFASAFTICAPIPELAPVTKATFPSQRSITVEISRKTVKRPLVDRALVSFERLPSPTSIADSVAYYQPMIRKRYREGLRRPVGRIYGKVTLIWIGFFCPAFAYADYCKQRFCVKTLIYKKFSKFSSIPKQPILSASLPTIVNNIIILTQQHDYSYLIIWIVQIFFAYFVDSFLNVFFSNNLFFADKDSACDNIV